MTIEPTIRAGTLADDEKAVAALDTQYQAAVKNNDAATMDRILADDFVLVTGLGKVYTKADLLEEARSKRTVYEHQEDSDQKVRVGRYRGRDRSLLGKRERKWKSIRLSTLV